MGRRLRTRLGLLKPSLEKHVEAKQFSSMVRRTAERGLRQFFEGDTVLARNYGRGDKWRPGVVASVLGTRHYIVDVCGNLWKRHVDQLLSRPGNGSPQSSDTNTPPMQFCSAPNEITGTTDLSNNNIPAPTVLQEEPKVFDNSQNALSKDIEQEASPSENCADPGPVCRDSTPTAERYTTRANRVPPSYLKDYELK